MEKGLQYVEMYVEEGNRRILYNSQTGEIFDITPMPVKNKAGELEISEGEIRLLDKASSAKYQQLLETKSSQIINYQEISQKYAENILGTLRYIIKDQNIKENEYTHISNLKEQLSSAGLENIITDDDFLNSMEELQKEDCVSLEELEAELEEAKKY